MIENIIYLLIGAFVSWLAYSSRVKNLKCEVSELQLDRDYWKEKTRQARIDTESFAGSARTRERFFNNVLESKNDVIERLMSENADLNKVKNEYKEIADKITNKKRDNHGRFTKKELLCDTTTTL